MKLLDKMLATGAIGLGTYFAYTVSAWWLMSFGIVVWLCIIFENTIIKYVSKKHRSSENENQDRN